jgi:hypothetical protein
MLLWASLDLSVQVGLDCVVWESKIRGSLFANLSQNIDQHENDGKPPRAANPDHHVAPTSKALAATEFPAPTWHESLARLH